MTPLDVLLTSIGGESFDLFGLWSIKGATGAIGAAWVVAAT